MQWNPQLPDILIQNIMDWIWEFHRADAVERFRIGRQNTQLCQNLACVCEDIRHNPPTYQLDILTAATRPHYSLVPAPNGTQRGMHMRMRLYLYECNPHQVQADLHLPESHCVSIRRCSLACRTLYTYPAMIEILPSLHLYDTHRRPPIAPTAASVNTV